MSVLAWGKCTIEMIDSTSGAPASGTWTTLPTPQQDSTKIEIQEGETTEAKEEGGEVVDSYTAASTASLVFTLFEKKGEADAIEHHDGKVAGEKAFRVIPEDSACKGRQFDRCKVSCVETYSTKDGILKTYTAKVLKPASGDMVKVYTKPAQSGGSAG